MEALTMRRLTCVQRAKTVGTERGAFRELMSSILTGKVGSTNKHLSGHEQETAEAKDTLLLLYQM